MISKKILLIILLLPVMLFSQSSLENILDPARLPYLKNSKMIQISSYDTTGGNNDRINLQDGEKAVIAEMDGPGVITRIWVTIDSRDPYFLRQIVLRMYWDGEENPSVEVPAGDFFGTGFEYKHYMSAFVGMSSGGYYSYFAMPFQKSARIEVENQTGQEVYAFYYQIDYQKLESPLDDDIAYFHAQWNRELRTSPDENYLVLDAEGRGHFVGVNMNMQHYRNSLWFLEGDEMIYVDGEEFPSVYGTGTEDYFTGGWYFNRGEFAGPYHGLILKDDSLARIAAYRFHVGDVIPFRKSLRFTIEHGHGNTEAADYSSTAYWYQKEPHKPFPQMLKASLRIPLRSTVPGGVTEAESLSATGSHISSRVEDMSDYGPEWSGLKQLKIVPENENSDFEVSLTGLEEDRFNVDIYYTRGPAYGDYNILYNGRKVGNIDGYSPEVAHGGKIVLGDLRAKNGKLSLTFKPAGKAAESVGIALGLDAFQTEPVRNYIPEWYVIGPFPNERKSDTERFGLDTVYPPEKEIDLNAAYPGADSQMVSWKKYQTPEDGRFQLWNKVNPYELVVTYALTYIYSPEQQTVPLLIGSDDGIKVFVNDKPVHRFLEVRISAPDQDRIPVKLNKGWNKLLLKIENNFGGYAFFARIIDPDKSLIFSTDKQK
ncbi:MAG: glycoside hydrolase family 172 protein [Calditrichia bacterium]